MNNPCKGRKSDSNTVVPHLLIKKWITPVRDGNIYTNLFSNGFANIKKRITPVRDGNRYLLFNVPYWTAVTIKKRITPVRDGNTLRLIDTAQSDILKNE